MSILNHYRMMILSTVYFFAYRYHYIYKPEDNPWLVALAVQLVLEEVMFSLPQSSRTGKKSSMDYISEI
jgi:hypothetical protein